MKISICTIPIRPYPTDFPPFGSMAIIQSLRKIGEEVDFFNIDYFRYQHDKIETYFRAHQFDVVGVSAVVSTAYSYTKYLTALIRRVSPKTTIIVGGNLAASAEILLRKCAVDFCVVGDGELIIQDLIRVLYQKPLNYDLLRATKGICFLDERGEFQFTGYGMKPAAADIEFPDYTILERDGSLPHFVSDKVTETFYTYKDSIPSGAKIATVIMAKGCIARCTFCHRWEQGYRVRPTKDVIDHVRDLMDRYNVRFLQVSDENFGADRKAAWEIATRLGELGIRWKVAGVRAGTVSKESLEYWKQNGCTTTIYGIESGSKKMLEVMEKKATVEKNINALRWTGEAGLETVVQLVIAMPGEDDSTIHETIAFLKEVTPFIKGWKDKLPSDLISINYAQALPGTPLYEYAREHGLIGSSIDEEEKYLMQISDTDAYSQDHFLNMTGLPLLKVLMWRSLILAHADANQYEILKGRDARWSLLRVFIYYSRQLGHRLVQRLKRKTANSAVKPSHHVRDYVKDSGYFNIHAGFKFAPLLLNPVTRLCFYPILAVATALRFANSPLRMAAMLVEHLRWSLRGRIPARDLPDKSLRKIVTIKPSQPEQVGGIDIMLPLRQGR